MSFTPDFLITPYIVKADPELRPSDSDIFSVIYWFEKMKEGRCIASNEVIAEVACCGVRNVRGSLDRLEKNGYIIRHYQDDARTKRSHIETTVSYTKRETNQAAPSTPGLPGLEEERPETPGEFAKRFFTGNEEVVGTIINTISQKTGMPEDEVRKEMKKFILYWTEPNKRGDKVRWQQQSTFEVYRRLYTWFGNKKSSATYQRAGAGRSI